MWRRTWLVFSQAVTVAVAMLFVVLTLKPEWLPGAKTGSTLLPTPTLVQVAPATAPPASGASGFALAARRAAPAVAADVAARFGLAHRFIDVDNPA